MFSSKWTFKNRNLFLSLAFNLHEMMMMMMSSSLKECDYDFDNGDELSDLELVVEEKMLKVHKAILGKISNYIYSDLFFSFFNLKFWFISIKPLVRPYSKKWLPWTSKRPKRIESICLARALTKLWIFSSAFTKIRTLISMVRKDFSSFFPKIYSASLKNFN